MPMSNIAALITPTTEIHYFVLRRFESNLLHSIFDQPEMKY